MQPAGLMRRFGAIVYDSLLVLALLFMTTLPFIAVRGGEPVASGNNLFYQITLALVTYLFFAGFWSLSGRTLGMQSWGLHLETPDGVTPGLRDATIRFFAAILSWAALGLGFFWQLWDKDHLAWHDRLSHTRLMFYPRASRVPAGGSRRSADPTESE